MKMNKTFFRLTKMMLLAVMVIMAACTSDDNATVALTVKVKVEMPEGFNADAVYAGHTVTMGNYTATTDETGVATFTGVIPDVYDLSTSCDITAEEYREMTGEESQNSDYVISGALLNQTVATETQITIQTSVSVKQSLVISKVYYNGTKDNNNKNYLAAQYLEFFNNSDKTIDIAGFYLGLVESESSPAYTLGATPDYIYLKQIFRFPTDRQIEVPAGGSILVVNSAIDHTDNNDVDLSGADFEVKDAQGRRFTNNPDVPAMELIYTAFSASTYMNLTQGGACSVVLFQTDEDTDNWERVYKQGTSRGSQYVKTPVKYITDGIDCLKNKADSGVDKTTKRLYDYIDAGYQFTTAVSGYDANVVYRKISQTVDGRNILADTNNSSNDFAVATDIKPREYR